MKIYRSLDEVPKPKDGCVLTVGNFDGVHLGHQNIIARARQLAREHSLPLVGMTFDPPAMKVLRPEKAPRILTPLEIKAELLAQQGLDELIIVKTTKTFLSLDPEQFSEQIVVERLNVRHIVEGPTFAFGKRRAGTTFSLKALAEQFGFQAHMVPAFTIDLGGKVPVALSSTLLRNMLFNSEFDKVRKCLKRDYELAGRVYSGRGRGRELGFPTANLELYQPEQLYPQDGVYAGFARIGDNFEEAWSQNTRIPAAISIGRCETFTDGTWQIEAFLMDYEPDAPGLARRHLLLSLVERIRPQQRFASPEELTRAIENDCQAIREVLKER